MVNKQQEFRQRFSARSECFLQSLQALCAGYSIQWQPYLCAYDVDQDYVPFLDLRPAPGSAASDNQSELISYCRGFINQGFKLDIQVSWSIDQLVIHVAPFEFELESGETIEWPSSVVQDFSLRWHGVKNAQALGISE